LSSRRRPERGDYERGWVLSCETEGVLSFDVLKPHPKLSPSTLIPESLLFADRENLRYEDEVVFWLIEMSGGFLRLWMSWQGMEIAFDSR
jgi:hypothetical protein